MVLAAVRDDTYNVFLFLHIAAFLVGFAPAVMNPIQEMYLRKNADDAALQRFAGFASSFTSKISLPALVVLPVTGIILILLSDDVIEFSDMWISASFLVWLAIGGVVSGVILKNEKAAAQGDLAALDKVATAGKIATVLTVVILYLMVFKPGA